MFEGGKTRNLLHIIAFLVFSYAFLLAIKPLSDPDLFWHIKSGQWIVENRSLPARDPFSFTTPAPLTKSILLGLRSQWLGQVIFYLVYKVGGLAGLSVFRATLIVCPFLLLYLLFVRRGAHPLSALAITGAPLFIIILNLAYTYERPQAFSFLFAALLLLVLDKLRAGPAVSHYFFLAVLMALWSNMHGGFILGDALIIAFAAGLVFNFVIYRNRDGLKTIPVLASGIAASFLNPGSYKLAYNYLSGFLPSFSSSTGISAAYTSNIFEYRSLWFFYNNLHITYPLYVFAFILAATIVLAVKYIRHSIDFPELFTAALLIVFGVHYARGAAFALTAMPLFMLPDARRSSEKKPVSGNFSFLAPSAGSVIIIALVFFTVLKNPSGLKPLDIKDGWVSGTYPEGAVEFIVKNNVRGPMFNKLEWGGYLLWKMPGGYKDFIDGRLVDTRTVWAYLAVIGAKDNWSGILDSFGVNSILTEVVFEPAEEVVPLVQAIIGEGKNHPEWKLVYLDGNTALFVKNTKGNEYLTDRFEVPYKLLYASMLEESDYLMSTRPCENALLIRGMALYGLGRLDEAAQVFESLPPSPVVLDYLKRIKKGT